jgi:hypothetical protein
MTTPSIIEGMLKSDRPRTIDRYINYFGGDGQPTLGDLGGRDVAYDPVDSDEQTV